MGKLKFEDVEVLPFNKVSKIGKRFDAILKDKMIQAVKDMHLNSYSTIYQYSNLTFLHWLQELSKTTTIVLREGEDGQLLAVCELVDGYEESALTINIPIHKLAKEALREYTLLGREDTIKALANELRKMADVLESGAKAKRHSLSRKTS